jgi:hypothetical protein
MPKPSIPPYSDESGAFGDLPPIGTRVKATNPNHPTFVGRIKEYVQHYGDECGNCFMAVLTKDDGHTCSVMLRSGRLNYYKLEAVPHGK